MSEIRHTIGELETMYLLEYNSTNDVLSFLDWCREKEKTMENLEDNSQAQEEVQSASWEYSVGENCVICSSCKEEHYIGAYHQFPQNFCPNCGAKITGKKFV